MRKYTPLLSQAPPKNPTQPNPTQPYDAETDDSPSSFDLAFETLQLGHPVPLLRHRPRIQRRTLPQSRRSLHSQADGHLGFHLAVLILRILTTGMQVLTFSSRSSLNVMSRPTCTCFAMKFLLVIRQRWFRHKRSWSECASCLCMVNIWWLIA